MYGGAKHDFEKEDKKPRDANPDPGPKNLKPDDETESDEEDEPNNEDNAIDDAFPS
jgi:hypothetical protein